MKNALLWYEQPATEWVNGMPLGNGQLGAMLLGGLPVERIALNHEALWRAEHRYRDTEPVHQHLAAIRQAFFDGDTLDAATQANATFGGPGGKLAQTHPNRVGAYQPAGDIFIHIDHADMQGYRRDLDLEHGIATVTHDAGGVRIKREVFVHANHPLIAIRLRAAGSGKFSASVRLERIDDRDCQLNYNADIHNDGTSTIGLSGRFTEGMTFSIQGLLIRRWGDIRQLRSPAAIGFERANELTFLFSIATSPDGEDTASMAAMQLAQALTHFDTQRDLLWDYLRNDHTRTWREPMSRFELTLDSPTPDAPTDQRLGSMAAGPDDHELLATYIHFGRYLITASSLRGDYPANLQGIWNEDLNPPWESDLHHDINLQMNYWPVEVTNLPELLAPYVAHLERFIPHARKVAHDLYGCRGVYFPIQTDIWGRATPESRGWDCWIGAAAWLSQHLWMHYEWGGDQQFLADHAYPFLKEVAAFYTDYLVPHPHDPNHRLVPVPSQSPENTFVGGTKPVSLCIAASFDLQLADQALHWAIQSSQILGLDADLQRTWQDTRDQLMPIKITSDGRLMEWDEERQEDEPGHRHFSHLWGLFPGDMITVEDTPQLAEAARKSLDLRLKHAFSQHMSGWSCSWAAGLYARLGDGDRALDCLRKQLHDNTFPSLLDIHPPRIFQIDGNLGTVGAVAEMLMQSHCDRLKLLPALPTAWPSGSVHGLRARGGVLIDITWKDHRPTTVTLRTDRAITLNLVRPAAGFPSLITHDSDLKTKRHGTTLILKIPTATICKLTW